MASRESSRRFHFLKEIASGGFGSVYLAKVMHADGFSRLAAIKLLHQRWSENAEIAQRMRDEARLLGWLRHRNIVDVIDLTTIGGRVAVIMEYLEAVDFKGAVQHVADSNEKMPPRAALEATAFVASALDAAYNRPPYQGEKPLRVIHRDIKPSNIMVDESGTVKVLDFGVARADFDHRESHTQELQFGSVDYMPPERLFFEPETPFSDVYSLGATLFEILALDKLGKAKGRPERHNQFLADRMAWLRTRADLPGLSGDAVVELIQQMCAYGHDARPSAAEVTQRCRALARGFEGEGLAEWAERVIPPLVKATRDAPREPNPLTDSVLSEDSVSFKAEDTFVEGVSDGGVVVGPQDPVPSEIPGNDARWEQLRDAARAEMQRPSPDAASALDDEVEVIDETIAPGAAVRPLAPTAATRSVMDAPSAPFLRLNQGAPAPAPQPAGPTAPAAPGPQAAPVTQAARPAAPPPAPASAPPPPNPLPPVDTGPKGAPRSLIPTPTMIPDDDYAPTQAFVAAPEPAPVPPEPPAPAPDPSAFGDEKTVVAIPGAPAPAAMEPPRPVTEPARPADLPRSSRPRAEEPRRSVPEPEPEPEAPRGRGWVVPAVLALVVLLAVGSVVVIGAGAWLTQQGYFAAATADVETPTAPTDTPPTPAASALVDGGINFVSAAPDTAKVSVTCDGREASGTDGAGVAGPRAEKCSVKVMLKDRTRLFAEVQGADAGTWRCFEGGSKECVR